MPPFTILVQGKGKLIARYNGQEIHNGDFVSLRQERR